MQSGSLHVFCVLPPRLLSPLDALRLYGETSVLSNEEAIVVFRSALDLFPVRHHRPFLLLGCPNARTDRHAFLSSRTTATHAPPHTQEDRSGEENENRALILVEVAKRKLAQERTEVRAHSTTKTGARRTRHQQTRETSAGGH